MPVDVSVLTTLEAKTPIDSFGYSENPISNGGKWTNQILLGEVDLTATGTAAQPSAASSDASAYRNDAAATMSADMGAMVTVTSKVSTDDGVVSIYIALQGAGLGVGTPNGYIGEVRIRTTGDEWRIQRIDVGIPAIISSGTIQEIASGDKFAVIRNGTAIELWWKSIGTGAWSFIVSATDATYSSGGQVGLRINDLIGGSPDSLTDDLKVTNLSVVSQAPSPGVVRVRMRAY